MNNNDNRTHHIDQTIESLEELRQRVLQIPVTALAGWDAGTVYPKLFQFHRAGDKSDGARSTVDAKVLARAILGIADEESKSWSREGGDWRGVKLAGFEVILHGAEPAIKPKEVVEL